MKGVRRDVGGHRGRMFQGKYRVSAASQKLRGSRWPALSGQQGPLAEGGVMLLLAGKGDQGRPEGCKA